ncbi:MAG: zinc ribbon domain-containing protein [Deltaproteobacteria bacterium]|nr:zinc ribbon domain-containing protein [Deltaproteobacteria bacterium]MBW2199222.1 zinc ribbon domain-containing protein [Deltaproteobacteria bacterium]MBW2538315.1 zinc ribbon domain-containing protein [Deltaproteobacteria bacterium]
MPIYEFRCLKCQECFEWLVISKNDEVEMKCPKCKSEKFERIISSTNYAVDNPGGNSGVKSTTRTCSSGSCTTYEIPGPTR